MEKSEIYRKDMVEGLGLVFKVNRDKLIRGKSESEIERRLGFAHIMESLKWAGMSLSCLGISAFTLYVCFNSENRHELLEVFRKDPIGLSIGFCFFPGIPAYLGCNLMRSAYSEVSNSINAFMGFKRPIKNSSGYYFPKGYKQDWV